VSDNKRSPLHDAHLELGGRIVPFAGWEMPVQYKGGIMEEHRAVRERCGVFDISHMGQFVITGASAEAALNALLTNNIAKLSPGEAQYTFLLNENGGVIDDLIAYRLADDRFFLIVNASKVDEDAAWISARLGDGITFENLSDDHGALAIQGPLAAQVFEKMFAGELTLPPRNGVATKDGVYVCRTGYTGEDGFELVCPATEVVGWLKKSIAAGAEPCGLGARDSLRLDMGYPLNGSDLSPERTPLEAGLGFFVDLKKGDFTGRDALLAQKENGLREKLCGFEMIDKGPPPRPHYPVEADGKVIGEICSAGLSPSLGIGIGMAYLPVAYSAIDTEIQIAIREKRYRARVVKKPFYKLPKP
jgi:aminomethyltransferase